MHHEKRRSFVNVSAYNYKLICSFYKTADCDMSLTLQVSFKEYEEYSSLCALHYLFYMYYDEKYFTQLTR